MVLFEQQVVSCVQGDDGNIVFFYISGIVLFSMIWLNGVVSIEISDLSVVIYSVMIIDIEGCIWDLIFVIMEFFLLVVNYSSGIVICVEGVDGILMLEEIIGGIVFY